MSHISIHQIEAIVPGKWLQKNNDEFIHELFTDTREVIEGRQGLFFAIQGQNHDGHDFILEAYKKGVRCFVIDQRVDISKYQEASFYFVENSLRALQDLSGYHRHQHQLPIIGITGSNGKTIVKEWLSAILSHEYYLVKSPKSFNSQVGVPLSLWQIHDKHKLGIFEAGLSKKGEMESLEKLIKPTLGIFTNLGSAHDEGFESREEKLLEKLILFKDSQAIIYRKDQQMVSEKIESYYSAKKLISWSTKTASANYFCTVHHDHLHVRMNGDNWSFPCPFSDPSLQENLIFCIVTALHLKASPTIISQEIESLKPVKMRLELKQGKDQTVIIDDSYNNDLKGLEIALQFLLRQKQYAKHTIILSSVFQSGLSDDDLYPQINKLLIHYGVDRLVGIGSAITHHSDSFSIPFEGYASTEDFLSNPPKLYQEVILVKGARRFNLEQVVKQLQQKTHRTQLVINLENMVHNLNYYRNKLDRSTKLMVMVKALAYGSGSVQMAQVLQHHKVDYLGVAYSDEAVELRKNGVTLPIMVMNVDALSFNPLVQYDLEPEIFSLSQLKAWLNFTKETPNPPAIHLKIETGMNRLGFVEDEMERLIELLKQSKCPVASIFSHLAAADDPQEVSFTEQQTAIFNSCSLKIIRAIHQKPLRHILNSAGINQYPAFQYDLVRLGIGLHGYDSESSVRENLRPVAHLTSTISQIKQVKAGETVSYGRTWKAKEPRKIATVAVGYADGYRRAFSNGVGKMMIKDQLVPVVGMVCMDMTMVDVTDVDCQEGDEVIVFGENPSIQELADWINSIPYEILTNVSSRVQRVYTSE